MGSALHFLKYVKDENIFNIKEFGVTADAETSKKHFRLTAEIISNLFIDFSKKVVYDTIANYRIPFGETGRYYF